MTQVVRIIKGVPKLLKTIKIVSELPSSLEDNTEYIVGDTNLIDITGLNGNNARLWQLVINGVAVGTATATYRLGMQFNGISTAYTSTNSVITHAGSASYQASTTEMIIGQVSTVNTSAPVVFSSNVVITPLVLGANVFRQYTANGANARTSTTYSHTNSGGFWRDASTNITSLQIVTESPSTINFAVGTTIELLQLEK